MVEDNTFHESCASHKLVITGQDEPPTEVYRGTVSSRNDIATKHEEAVNIIIQQVLACVSDDPFASITVICDDTDVFVLLLYYYHVIRMTNTVTMESPIKGRAVIDVSKLLKNSDIVHELLPAHALSGCDTVAGCYGIRKGTVVNALRAGLSLSLLGSITSSIDSVISQVTAFMSYCYGQTNCSDSMSDTRLNVWASKIGKGSTSSNLSSIPPTKEAFAENVKRAHFQACVWLSLQDNNHPSLDPTEFGWKRDEQSKTLQPVTLPDHIDLAPAFILKLIRCSCQSDTPCSIRMCSCKHANMICTIYCNCYNRGCNNITT